VGNRRDQYWKKKAKSDGEQPGTRRREPDGQNLGKNHGAIEVDTGKTQRTGGGNRKGAEKLSNLQPSQEKGEKGGKKVPKENSPKVQTTQKEKKG